MGGRGSAGKSGGGGGGGASNTQKILRENAASNPESAPVGTKLSMGGYNYTKNSNGTWTTFGPTGKRVANRTDADIRRVFT